MPDINKPALLKRIREAQDQRGWSEAVEGWRECLAAFPDDPAFPQWRARLADALFNMGRIEEASGEFRGLVEIAPELEAGLTGLARIAVRENDWPAALERWDACLDRFPDSPRAPRWQGSRAQALFNLDRLEEAQNTFESLAEDATTSETALAGLARIAEKRGAWNEAAERWRACLERAPQSPAAPGWKRAEIFAIERAGRREEALAAWRQLTEAGGGAEARFHLARSLFEVEGSSDEAERLAREALAVESQGTRARRLLAGLMEARGRDGEALSLFMDCVEAEPGNLDHYAAAAAIALRFGAASACGRLLQAPASLATDTNYLARVKIPMLDLAGEIESAKSVAAALDPEELDWRGARALGDFWLRNQQYAIAASLARRFHERFLEVPAIAGLYLNAVYRAEGKSAYDDAKAAVLSALAPEDRIKIYLALPQAWLSVQEAAEIIDYQFDRDPVRAVHSPAVARLASRGDTEILERVAARFKSSEDPSAQLMANLFLATSEDRRRIALARFGKTSWSEFEIASARLSRDIGDFVARSDLKPDLRAAIGAVLDAGSRAAFDWLFTTECYYDAAMFALWLRSRIRRRIPTSILRIGDGEGRFLPYEPELAGHQRADIEAIQRIWWREPQMSNEDVDRFSEQFAKALADADAIGAPPPGWLATVSHGGVMNADVRGNLSGARHVGAMSAETLAGKVLTSWRVHIDLEQWGLYPLILAPGRAVSVVSCFDLKETLLKKFGVETRRQYLVPPEHASAGVVRQELEKPFFPDVFERIMKEIAPEPGELVLVAAGFLGKLICARVKERGGVGFDVGSIVDFWMGHATRAYGRFSVDFDLPSSLIEAHPALDDPGGRVERGSGACFSDDARRRDVLPSLSGPVPRAEGGKLLRVIGHPRCGSGYAAEMLRRMGVRVGHERMQEDGVCGWLSAVEDLNPPFAAPAALASDFQVVAAYVRDPEAATASIIVENGASKSFAFRRFHIFRELGVNLAAFRDPAARAVASYMYWMDLVDRQNPIAWFRVERFVEDLETANETLARHGVALDWRGRPSALTVRTDINGAEFKESLAKPTLPADWRERLPGELREKLQRFCERHGYR